MKIAILGDTHFGMRGDSLEFHKYYHKFYKNVFFPFLKENNIDTIFQMGDLFDRRKFINFNSLFLCRKYFFDKLKENNITLHTLIGNHDIFYKNTLEVNSTKMLLGEYNNIVMYDKPKTVEFDELKVDIIPWICSDNEEQIKEFIKNTMSHICFGHFEIAGFEMDKGNICHEGFDKGLLVHYDVVLSGHFHHKSSDGQITYVGTPGEMTWADHDDERGFHVFDTSTRELTFIKNPYRMFHKIVYDDSEQDFDFWKSKDFSSLKETYVKVVVLNKTNPFLFDYLVDQLYKTGVSDISIVEDFFEYEDDNDEESVDQGKDTISIINGVIDGIEVELDKNQLKNVIKEVYIEALNVQQDS